MDVMIWQYECICEPMLGFVYEHTNVFEWKYKCIHIVLFMNLYGPVSVWLYGCICMVI